jgi:undecaprenyl diphosphate synthase
MVKNNVPEHIAFIMDGNGRWAKEKCLPRFAGHRAGAQRVKEIVSVAGDLGVKVVTFFTFSTENWARPKKEVDMLMHFLGSFLRREEKTLRKNNIRFMAIGQENPLPKALREKIKQIERDTKDNTGVIMVLALNYGARREIVEAVKRIVNDAIKNKIDIDSLNEDLFSRYLFTAGLPDPDFLIRTSGEMRISNFLLWQLSYAEIYFTNTYWPDFGENELKKAITVYQNRERKFGKISPDNKNE